MRNIKVLIATPRKVIVVALIASLAAGCGSNVRLDPPTIPTPLIDQIPMSVTVRMPDHFESFVHQEDVLGREEWTMDLGRSNAVFFSQLFEYMFSNVTVIKENDDLPLGTFDILIEPSIDAFEFSVPNQTRTEAFSVWIRYRIKIYDRDGQLVVNAPFSAYGKSLTTTMGGDEALQRAAILAMRDAAALMIMKFDEELLQNSLENPLETTASGANEAGEPTAQATPVGGGKSE